MGAPCQQKPASVHAAVHRPPVRLARPACPYRADWVGGGPPLCALGTRVPSWSAS